jgi:hypothetical protein
MYRRESGVTPFNPEVLRLTLAQPSLGPADRLTLTPIRADPVGSGHRRSQNLDRGKLRTFFRTTARPNSGVFPKIWSSTVPKAENDRPHPDFVPATRSSV